MSETIRLFNTGKNTIQYSKEGFFRPGTAVDFPIAVGSKLQKLYKDQLRTEEQFIAPYTESAAPSKEEVKVPAAPVEEKATTRRGYSRKNS